MLSQKIDIKMAFVIGSVARGDFTEASDIDVVIIAKDLPKHPIERMRILYEEVPPLIE